MQNYNNKSYLSRDQKIAIKREQNDYRQRLKANRKTDKHKYHQPIVLSTTVISEPTFKEQYNNFLRSDFWKKQRNQIIKYWSNCCICHSKENLNVHHISYENVFANKFASDYSDDYVIVCRYHHELFHKEHGVKKIMKNEWKQFFTKQKPHGGKASV